MTSTPPTPPTNPAAGEVLKTQPPASGAGAGGWVPSKGTPIWAAVLIGTLFTSGPAVGAAVSQWNTTVGIAVGAVLLGVAGSLATYFGVRSAGPRK